MGAEPPAGPAGQAPGRLIAPSDAAPDGVAHHGVALHDVALHDVAPHDVAPHDAAPHDAAPNDAAAGGDARDDDAPDAAPDDATADDAARKSHVRAAWAAVTTRGRTAAVVTLLAALLGAATGWREWTAIAAALGVLLVAAVLMALGRSSCDVLLELTRTRVVVGEPAAATVLVRNTARRRMLPLRMELDVAGLVRSVPVPSLRGGQSHAVRIPLPTGRRAALELGPLLAVRGDVFGFIRRVVRWEVYREVFVHPRTTRPGSALPGFVRDLEGEESTLRTASDLSFHTLREYVPGDDRRFIHWKSSARSGTLQVREFLQTHRSLVAVVLAGGRDGYCSDGGADDDRPSDDQYSEEFEVAVSCAASLVAELVRQRRELVTDAAGLTVRGVTVDGVLDQFCGVQAAVDAPDLIEQTRRVMRRHPRVSLLLLVVGSAVTPAELRAAFHACPPGARVLALRARSAASPYPARLVGWQGNTVLTVSDVDALPAALRAVG